MPVSICILTPAPDYWEDWSLPKAHYERLLGPDLSFRSWTDTGDLSGFSLILPLLAWGYQRDVAGWYALLDRLEREALPVANPARVLRWNSDKAYLAEMAAAGVPTVPTMMREAMNDAALDSARSLFGTNRLVIKPPVSGGADGTFLIGASDPLPAEAVGRRMLIQPYLPAIAAEGETSLFFFGGRYSHAISKHPANGDFRVQEQFGGSERRIDPPTEALALAETVFVATEELMDHAPLTYARVDMLRDEDGNFRLMELEAIEPSLFLHFAGDQGALFADAVRARS
jgi:glutathione synthase/RimK-type ligase-like ATP-grasp enzyme